MKILVQFFHQLCYTSIKRSQSLIYIMETTNTRTLRSKTTQKIGSSNVDLKIKPKKVIAKKETSKQLPNKSKVQKTVDVNVMKIEDPIIKSEYFDEDNKLSGSQVKLEPRTVEDDNVNKKRSAKKIKDSSIKPEKKSKIKIDTQTLTDIEDGVWRPENWKEVLDNILQMRKLYTAPVDSLGCEECPEDGAPPEVFRYQTLISVMLSSQTRDEVTFAATQRLIEHGLTVDSILSTPDEKIGELIYPAGFWKSKIKFIKNTTQILKDQYSGDIPRTFKELCKLPGVGPKMANIVMSVAWNETVGIAVDTHVHRISNRLGWVPKPTKEPEQTRKVLESWLPKDQWHPINITLVGFGQTICKPVGPSCEICLNKDLCPFGKTALTAKLKKKSKK